MNKYYLFILALSILSCDLLENNIGNVSLYDEPNDYQLKKMIEHDPRYSDIIYFMEDIRGKGFWEKVATDGIVDLEFKKRLTYKSFLSWLYEQRCKDMGNYRYRSSKRQWDYRSRSYRAPQYGYESYKSLKRSAGGSRFVERYIEGTNEIEWYKRQGNSSGKKWQKTDEQDPNYQSYIYDFDYVLKN